MCILPNGELMSATVVRINDIVQINNLLGNKNNLRTIYKGIIRAYMNYGFV